MTAAAWIIVALIVVFGVALFSRRRGASPQKPKREDQTREPAFPSVPPLQPGEQYDTTVKIATVPNVPMAELVCQRFREHGIEAFYKGATPLSNAYGTGMTPGLPAELWVGAHDAARAQELMREFEIEHA